jgi:glycosyltransferase involved in cell wall biosynthesis
MTAPDQLVIINDFSSAEGGAGYLANALAEGVAARGLPVTFIAGDAGKATWPKGVTPIALGGRTLLDGHSGPAAIRGLYNRTASAHISNWIAQHDTPRTVYHLHNWSNILSPAAFDALAPCAARCVFHAHDFFLSCPNGVYLDYPRAEVCERRPLSVACLTTNCDKRAYAHKLWRAARQHVLRTRLSPHLSAASFVMIHPAMRPWLTRAIQPQNLLAIRNPITPFGPPVRAPERQHRLAHIGQVQRLKGVYELAEAARRCGAHVDFFGGGEDLADLQTRYPEHTWHGWTDRETIGRHLHSIRAVVVATQSPEPFCLAAFESAATGLPLVVSDSILAAHELVESGTALPFAAGDVDALTTVLDRVMTDDALVANLARATNAGAASLSQSLPDWITAHMTLYAEKVTRIAPSLTKELSLVTN